MSNPNKKGPADSWPKCLCPGIVDGVSCSNTLIRGEKHARCFDCLDHGPLSIRDLRCEICVGWSPKQFISATSRYIDSSQSKIDAKAFMDRENAGPTAPPQEERTEAQVPMDTTDPPPPLLSPVVGIPQSVPPPPGMLVTPEQLQENIAAVLKSFGIVPAVGESAGGKRKESVNNSSSSSDSAKKPKKKKRLPSASLGRPADLEADSQTSGSHRSNFDRGTAVVIESAGSDTQLGVPLNQNTNTITTDQGPGCSYARAIDSHGRESGHVFDARFGAPLTHSQHVGLLGAANMPSMLMQAGRGSAAGIARLASCRGAGPSSGLSDRASPSIDRVSRASKSSEPRSIIGDSHAASDSESDSDIEEAGEIRSNFRWALESIYQCMGRTVKEPAPSIGRGRFATKPKKEQIMLPMATTLLDQIADINKVVTVIKETGRSEPSFPSIKCKAKAQDTYASEPTDGYVTRVPRDDEMAGLIPRKKSAVWSANVKKARLSSWQTLSHQLMGQLSTSDHLTQLVQEVLDDADLSAEVASRAQAALSVLLSTIQSAEKVSATLSAHLDLTARESDLRTFDLCENDFAKLRARPLFEGRTFAGLTGAEVDSYRTNRREEALLDQFTSKAKPAKEGKKMTKTTTVTSTPMPAYSTSTRQPFRTPAPPKKEGKSKRGRGRGSKSTPK